MEEAGVKLIAAGANAYVTDIRNATNITNNFVSATESGGGRVSSAGQVMIGALRRVGAAVVELGAQGVKAIASFVGDSINLAGDFEQTMNVLQATSDATAEEMGDISAKAKELGADLTLPATSAVDAGNAMLELSKAGFSVADSMDAAKGVLQLAAAAQIDEAKAAEINANAINAFNLEAKDSIFISDLLAASANASSVEITDVADSYQMAGAIFASFQGPVVGSKQAIVDLTTAVGILGNAGIKGSDAGTSLKQSLLQLTGPSQKAKDAMRALYLATIDNVDAGQNLDKVLAGNASARAEGIRGLQESAGAMAGLGDIAYDAAGNMRPFEEILALTAKATKGMNDEQRNLAITTIFGADAARAILVLMNEGPEAWDKMSAAVTRQNAAQALAEAQTKGFKGALEGAKSQLETLQLTLAERFLPVLASLFTDYISPGISKINDFAISIFSANDPVQALITSIREWSPLMSGIIDTIQFVSDNIAPILAGISGAILTVVVPAFTAWAGAALTAAPAVIAAMLPVVAPIVAIGAAAAALTLAWQNDWLGIRTVLTDFWTTTGQPIFTELQTWLAANLPVAIQTVSDFWTGTLQPALQVVGGFLTGTIFPIIGELVNVWLAVAKVEVQALADLWTGVLWPALQTVWSFISGTLIPIIAALVDVNIAILQKASEALAGFWQNVLKPAFAAVSEYVSGTLMPALQSAGSWLSDTFGPILSDVTGWLGKVTGGFGGVKSAVSGLIDKVHDFANSIRNLDLPDWLTPGSPTPWEIGLRGVADALKTEVNPNVAELAKGIASLGTAAPDPLADLVGGSKAEGEKKKPAKVKEAANTFGSVDMAPVVDPIEQYIIEVANAIGGVITREQAAASLGLTPTAPVASSAQIAAGAGQYAPIHMDNSSHYTMPIYTNQSPQVLQDSLAIAKARSF